MKISQMPRSLTAFTVCLWMNTIDPQGTLVSYAVSDDSENELLIDYEEEKFSIQIGGKER